MIYPDYCSPAFIQQLMQAHQPKKNITVKTVEKFSIDNSASILAVLTAQRTTGMVGHAGLQVAYEEAGVPQVRRMVLKIKPHGTEIVEMLNSLAQACGGQLAPVYEKYKTKSGFQYTHVREQEIYGKLSPSFSPEIFGLHTDDQQQVYMILMEYLEEVELLNSVMQPALWTNEHITAALQQLAGWHASMLKTTSTLDLSLWDDAPSLPYMQELTPLWQALLDHAATCFPDLYTTDRVELLQQAIHHIPDRWRFLSHLPKTLIHNDCNPRNACFKQADDKKKFCLYDWELSTFHIPQYDVVELLCFVLDKDRYSHRAGYIEYYRQELHKHTGQYADAAQFNYALELAALDFALHRVGMYVMAHTVNPYPFLPRVIDSLFDTISRRPA